MKHCETCICGQLVPRDESCRACRSRNKSTWDVHAAAQRIRSGEATMAQIALEVGTSRQNIDQGLRTHGERRAVLEGRNIRREIREQERAERKKLQADLPRPYERKPGDSRVISSTFMLESMQAVYKFLNLDEGMSHFVYNEFRPKTLPSSQAIIDRFDTWNNACEAAGLPVTPPAPARRYFRVPKEKALDDLKRYILEYRKKNGRYARITNSKYDIWARDKENNAVSRAHIAKRYGWSLLLQEALNELYGDQSDAPTGS